MPHRHSYSSPYARAVQTVEPIAADHDLPVVIVATSTSAN
ncbi:histidine phosphatase family protein [Haladaptatus sp. CMSO5]